MTEAERADATERKGRRAVRKDEAQKRVDQIQAFRVELEALERDGVLNLEKEQHRRLSAHHDRVIRALSREFDVDTSPSAKQLSWGMRLVSFFGAVALSAALVLLFRRYWGHFSTWVQVVLLAAAPLLGLLLTELAARRERTRYFTALAALIAFAAFVLDVSVLGAVFNLTPSQSAFLAWAGFALLLAYTYGLRLLQVAGIACLLGYLAATVGTWSGCYWINVGERPENFIAAGAAIAAVGAVIPHGRLHAFRAMYRVFGLLAVFIGTLVLANWGQISYLDVPVGTVEALYQTFGFLLAALAVWVGIRVGWPDTVNLGAVFFSLFLYTKMFDWLWEWMPKWLFFLLVGGEAIGLLVVLVVARGHLRRGIEGEAP